MNPVREIFWRAFLLKCLRNSCRYTSCISYLRKRFEKNIDNLILSSTFLIPCGKTAGLPDDNFFSWGLIPREKVLDLFTKGHRNFILIDCEASNASFL